MKDKFSVVSSEEGRQFDFVVEGMVAEKIVSVHKRVLLDSPDKRGLTNMALVDVCDDGSLSDDTRSGLGQMNKIFATVASCLLNFMIEHPTETVYFTGSDPESRMEEADGEKLSLRQILYNRVLSKEENYKTASNYFVIYGVYKESIALYKPNSQAKAFLIQLKK